MELESRKEILNNFDPNTAGASGSLFGLPFSVENAFQVIIPVPWEVTVSYRSGTAKGPSAILEASSQVDLFIRDIPDAWKLGIAMLPISDTLFEENKKFRKMAFQYIKWIESNATDSPSKEMAGIPGTVNAVCEKLNNYVKSQALMYHKDGKMLGLLGGDHSTPLGMVKAMGEIYESFGVLQIDAHADLRKGYENFKYSHASIMYNILEHPKVAKAVQVGIRDLCEEEMDYIENSEGRVVTFFDQYIQESKFEGKSWDAICDEIISHLPDHVYITVDIDGLNPLYCPNTGTPVPGGMEYSELKYLLKKIVLSGRFIIGFDLCEVAPGNDEWDANVGSRILFDLCNFQAVSQGKLTLK